MHNQVIIKVNAKVDKGIAPLVAALNEIIGLLTLDSCEKGILDEGYVFFSWGKDWHGLGHLLDVLYEELTKVRLEEHCSLSIQWCDKSEWPRGLMIMPKEHVAILAENIQRFSEQINLRMSQSDNGSVRKEDKQTEITN